MPPEYILVQLAKELNLSADRLFLAAGTLPPDIREAAGDAKNDVVKAAFSAFRREVKGKGKESK